MPSPLVHILLPGASGPFAGLSAQCYYSAATTMRSGGNVFAYFQSFHNTGVSEGNVQCFASLLVWIEVRLTFYGAHEGSLLLIKKIEGQGREEWCV